MTQSHQFRYGRWLLAALLLLVLLSMPLPAAAHPRVLRTEPEARQVLNQTPTEVVVWFSEDVSLEFSSIQVLDRGRRHYETGGVRNPNGDRTGLATSLTSTLPSGIYTVVWRILSTVDGHVVEGSFVFSVRLPGEPTPTPGAEPEPTTGPEGVPTDLEASTTPPVSPLRWVIRALALLLAAGLLGGPLFTILILEPALTAAEEGPTLLRAAHRRWSRLGLGAALLLVGLLAGDMLFQLAEVMAITPGAAGAPLAVLPRLLNGTSYGMYWMLRVGAAVGLGLLCAWAVGRGARPGPDWSLGVAASGLLFVGEALSSHQAAVPPIAGLPLGTLSDLVHLMATGAWVGGLLYCALVLLPLLYVPTIPSSTRGQLLGLIIPRFSRLALLSIGLLIITGFSNLAFHTLDPNAIVSSQYGQVLLVKHLLFLPLLVLGAIQNRRILPRLVALLKGDEHANSNTVPLFRRVIGAEVALASAVILCAGGLTLLPPPVPPSAVAAPPPTVLPRPSPAPPGTPTPSPTPVIVTATQTLGGLEVSLRVQPDLAGDQFTIRLRSVATTTLIPNDLRVQLHITPQDVNAGSTLLTLSAASAVGESLVYTTTEPMLTLAGGYEARITIAQRSGNDVKVAYRLDLGEDGTLTIRPAPYIQVQVSSAPSPAISGTVQIDLRVTDGLGAPLDGATVDLLPIMPSHAHIQPLSTVVAVPGTPGLYRTTARLDMGGSWLMIISVQLPGQPVIKTDATLDVIDPNATPTPGAAP